MSDIYRVYFEHYQQAAGNVEEGIEFLYIEGKGNHKIWESFLKKFEIKTYHVGDLDNILEEQFGIINALKGQFTEAFEAYSGQSPKCHTNQGSYGFVT